MVFFAINRGELADTVRRFLKERAIDAPVVLDRDDSVSSAFGVQGMPHLAIIDRAGTVRNVHLGSVLGTASEFEERLREEIAALLAD